MGPQDLLDYWFDRTLEDPSTLPERMGFWFGSQDDSAAAAAARDDELRRRFGSLVERVARGELAAWERTAKGRLALILLTDQWPRNVHRGTARAYAGDGEARRLCLEGLELGHDRELHPLERLFFYLPLEHSESLADQDFSVRLIGALEREAPRGLEKAFAGFTRYAVWHRDIIARFGRFPHRNRALGRASTPQEEAYLAGGAPTFGQR